MKKTILIYGGILVGLFVILSLLGRNSEYAIEQMTWKVQRQYFDILKDPKVIPDQTFLNVIRDYEKIIKRYPDSKLTQGLRMLVGHVYFLKKDYDSAHKKFNEIIKLFPDNKELQAEALGAIGRVYETQENWPQAKKTYDRLIADYPLTQTGLGVPIYIANYFRQKNDYQKTLEAYDRAIAHYNSLAAQNPDSATGYVSLRYLSNCYLDQKRWREGVDTLGKILDQYAKAEYMNVQTADIIIKTINTVSVYQLKDYDLPIRIYQNIVEKNPNHPLKDYFQKMVNALASLKAKSVQVAPVK